MPYHQSNHHSAAPIKTQLLPFLFRLFYWAPLLLISLAGAAIPYLGLSTLYQLVFHQPFESITLYAAITIGLLFLSQKVVNTLWRPQDFQFRLTHLLFFFCAVVVAYRSVIYFHAIDDFAFHLMGGFYAGRIWSESLFMPTDMSTYLFPMLQTMYYFLVKTVGIRFSLLFLSGLQLLWFLHLNNRFATLIFPKEKNKRYWVDLFFVFLFFLPELVSTHVTFMSDFYSTLFALEALYAFLRKGRYSWLIYLMTIAVFCKQSSGIFLIPFFVVFALLRLKSIQRTDVLLMIGLLLPVVIFHAASYLYTGNPTSFLLNSTFQSPLYPLDDFRDRRWGPQTWWQSLLWPLYGPLSTRYVEPIAIARLQPFFSLFVIVPFISSIFFAIKKRSLLFLVAVGSYLFWAFYSGYGRYQIAFTAMVWMLLFIELRKRLPGLNMNWKVFGFYVLFAFVCFSTVRADYALRGFFLERFFPPKISSYHFQLYKDGLGYFGRDRYIDIYRTVQDNFKEYGVIANGYRGIVTYYSFLANMFEDKPIVSAVTPEQLASILSSEKLNPLVTQDLRQVETYKPILLMADDGHLDTALKSEIYLTRNCIRLTRKKTAPQFQHDNFFNHVVEFTCQ